MKASSAKAKGNKLEEWVVDKLVSSGLDTKAFRTPGSGNGNRYKADVETKIMVGDRTIAFECKNHKKAQMREWWEQTTELESTNRFPVLVYKLEGERYEEAKAVIYLNDLIELLLLVKNGGDINADENGIFIADGDKWKVKRLKDSCAEVLKLLNN